MPNKKKIVPRPKKNKPSAKRSSETLNLSPFDGSTSNTKIKIIGIGGGGCSIVSEISTSVKKVDFVVANTDRRTLKETKNKAKPFQFGDKVTGGFGTGMNQDLGREAALSDKEKIKKMLEGQDMCIFVSSFGGGTGAGATPVFAKIAKDLGIITYGIFTFPFDFEGSRKMEIALDSLENVKEYLNAITLLPNENIFNIIDKKTPLKEALSVINRNLSRSLEGLIETIYAPGLINIDFADLRTILEGRGKLAYLNTTEFDASKGVEEAIKRTVSSPFCSYGIEGAGSVLFNIVGSDNLGLRDVSSISEGISGLTGKNSKVIFGISQERELRDRVKITLLAVGCNSDEIFHKGKKAVKKGITKETQEAPSKKKPKLKKKIENKNGIKREEGPLTKEDNEKRVDVKVRRNALEAKKIVEEIEREMMEDENKWESPAFIRRNALNEKS